MVELREAAAWRLSPMLPCGLAVAWLIAGGCGEEGDDGLIPPPQGTFVINELLALNDSTLADEAGEYDDWLELWNPGPDDATTGGLYLSDDFGTPLRWALPETTVSAGDHLLIWTDNGAGRWHATFRLSGDGEVAALHRLTGTGPVLIDSVSYGAQKPDTSYARQPDGGAWSLDPTPTPAAANN